MIIKDVNNADVALPTAAAAAARCVADMFRNHGVVEATDSQVDWSEMAKILTTKDAIATPDIRPILQSSLQILIREPLEPLLQITPLFTRVMSKGMNTQVLAGAMGAIVADDVAEDGLYPEVSFQLGGGMQTASIGKSGLQVSFTDEALRYSTWDIMALNMRNIGKALARHKEQKAVGFLKTLGTELFNNASPTTSVFGVTTGRGLDMAANGSPTQDDLFKAMAHMGEEGFHPNVLLVNPQMFYLGIQDPVLRSLFMQGMGGAYFNQWGGNEGPMDPWSNGAMGAQGPSLGNRIVRGGSPAGGTATGIAGREHGMTSTMPFPNSYFGWPMQVIVSPFVPFDAERQVSDIYLLSSGNVGYHLVDEEPVTVEWRDEALDRQMMKVRERYGFAVAHEGMGVGVMKNVKLTRNFWDGIISATTDAVTAEIDPEASISL